MQADPKILTKECSFSELYSFAKAAHGKVNQPSVALFRSIQEVHEQGCVIRSDLAAIRNKTEIRTSFQRSSSTNVSSFLREKAIDYVRTQSIEPNALPSMDHGEFACHREHGALLLSLTCVRRAYQCIYSPSTRYLDQSLSAR